jgi:hypothetical protein
LQRLHSKLKDAVEKQLEALPFGTGIGNDICADDETVRILQEQLQLANQVSSIFFLLTKFKVFRNILIFLNF